MRKAVYIGMAALALGAAYLARPVRTLATTAAVQRDQAKTVSGQVQDKGAPVPDAVVYLKNTKSLAVKTFIADGKGNYRFHALSPNVDYEVWAEHAGRRSDTKTVSSFDSRTELTINLSLK